ncbi:hypothetical protein [Moorena producens]|uniref:hypothetical protein n=1 Tax=Moorena producens TaxID=1155739 RepID=UPI003C71AF75
MELNNDTTHSPTWPMATLRERLARWGLRSNQLSLAQRSISSPTLIFVSLAEARNLFHAVSVSIMVCFFFSSS